MNERLLTVILALEYFGLGGLLIWLAALLFQLDDARAGLGMVSVGFAFWSWVRFAEVMEGER